jgi:hypothetical protein
MKIDVQWANGEKRLIVNMTRFEAEQLYVSIGTDTRTETAKMIEHATKKFFEKEVV